MHFLLANTYFAQAWGFYFIFLINQCVQRRNLISTTHRDGTVATGISQNKSHVSNYSWISVTSIVQRIVERKERRMRGKMP